MQGMKRPASCCTSLQAPAHPPVLQCRGADPSVRTENYDPYLSPGLKTPREVALDEDETQDALAALEAKYAGVKKVRVPHTDVGDWWALYDYGRETIAGWAIDYVHPYPGPRAARHLCSLQACRSACMRLPAQVCMSCFGTARLGCARAACLQLAGAVQAAPGGTDSAGRRLVAGVLSRLSAGMQRWPSVQRTRKSAGA